MATLVLFAVDLPCRAGNSKTAISSSDASDHVDFDALPSRKLTFPKMPYGKFGELSRFFKAGNPEAGDCEYHTFYHTFDHIQAVGTVSIAAKQPTSLTLNSEASNQLGALLDFAPNDIQELIIASPADDEIQLQNLSRLTGLIALHISNTDVQPPDLSPLKRLVNLRQLAIDLSNLSGDALKTISNFPKLIELSLNRTALTSVNLSPLTRIANLRSLDLTSIPIKGEQLSTLEEISTLRRLALSYSQLDDTGWDNIARLSNLHDLKLDHTKIGDRALEKISSLPLSCLAIDSTSVTDKCLQAIARIKTLKYLNVDHDKISEGALQRFRNRMPKVMISARKVDAKKLYNEYFGKDSH
ncbi:MAG TPA: hypothetical protein V6C72_03490 [Chroococcales cyanobacterium]